MKLVPLGHTPTSDAPTASRVSPQWMAAAIDGLRVGMVVVDAGTGHIVFANPFAEQLFGFPTGTMPGHDARTLVTDADRATPDFFSRARTRALDATTEWTARAHDGREFPVELQLTQCDADTGLVYVALIRDITERQALDKIRNEFMSTVGHELRTPITSIRTSLGLLDGGVAGQMTPSARELVGVANRSVTRLIALINDLLNLERAGREPADTLPYVVTSVDELVTNAMADVAAAATARQVAIEATPCQRSILADPTRAQQVIAQLLANAVKFSPAHSIVQVECRVEDRMLRMSILDRGPGVPAAFHSTIFEPFRQVTSDDRDRSGNGLGLTIARAIVRQHGGRIGVDDRPGGGAAFWFTLPLASEPRV